MNGKSPIAQEPPLTLALSPRSGARGAVESPLPVGERDRVTGESRATPDRVRALQREFDDSFAAPAVTPNDDVEKLLAIVVAGHSYALDLSDLRGLLADRTIVPLPTSVPSFLGVIGDRRMLVPVFDLASLLGYPLSKETRWIALTGTAELPIGLAFEKFEAQLQVDRAAASSSGGKTSGDRRYITHVVVSDGEVRPVVDVAALLGALPRASAPFRKER